MLYHTASHCTTVLHHTAPYSSDHHTSLHCTIQDFSVSRHLPEPPDPSFLPLFKRVSAFKHNSCADQWKLLRYVLPCPKVIFDIGANKGYTAAAMLALWLPSLGVDPAVWQKSRDSRITALPEFDCGMCGDCLFTPGASLEHIGKLYGVTLAESLTPGGCSDTGDNLTIYSFDGQKEIKRAHDQRIEYQFPQAAKHWRYETLALSNVTGKVEFMQVSSWEAGKMRDVKDTEAAVTDSPDSPLVHMTTVDRCPGG